MKIKVESAVKIEPNQADAIKSQLETVLNQPVELKFKVDPLLIGGIRLVLPHKVIDLSLKAQLEDLSDSIQQID
jgi:F0F1-type ATP synthase delta subunit